MSQRKSPHASLPPKDRNYLLLCQQIPKSHAKVRSGIIERYTYKKGPENDPKTQNVNVYYNEHKPNCAVSFVQSNASCASGSSSGTVRPILINHDSPVSKKYDRSFLGSPRASPIVINGNSSNSREDNEKVRTEHCDSTTDIIENDKKKLYRRASTPNHFSKLESASAGRGYSSSHISDSDSDCQIIDCNISLTGESGNKIKSLRSREDSSVEKVAPSLGILNKQMENPNTKVLSWIGKKEDQSEPEIHIISDDDEVVDKPPKDHQKQTTYISTITTVNGQDNAQLTVQLKPHVSTDMSAPSVDKKLLEKVKNSLSFINEKYQKVKSQMNQTKTEMISTPLKTSNTDKTMSKLPEMCSILRENTPPRTPRALQSPQKNNAPMSPESMKSEFYNYLKINTNPSAQKEEIVEKNRRSTRVKNLALQVEKAKEQNSNRENEDEKEESEVKKKDIRKKYLKYSKLKVTFPPIAIEHNSSIDFDDFIEGYFRKEGISYVGLKEKENNIPTRKILNKICHTRTNKLIVTRSFNHKIMMRPKYKSLQVKNNKVLKVKHRLKPRMVKKMIGCTPHVSDIKIDRLRYKPNRAFRNARKYGKTMSNSRTRIRKSNSDNLLTDQDIPKEPQLKVSENLIPNRSTTPREKNVDAPIKRSISPLKRIFAEDRQVKKTTACEKNIDVPIKGNISLSKRILAEDIQIKETTARANNVSAPIKRSLTSSKISLAEDLLVKEITERENNVDVRINRSMTPSRRILAQDLQAKEITACENIVGIPIKRSATPSKRIVAEAVQGKETAAHETIVDVPIKRNITPSKRMLAEDLQVNKTTALLKKVLEGLPEIDLQVKQTTAILTKVSEEPPQINQTTLSKMLERRLSVSSIKSADMKLTLPENKITIREVESSYKESKNKMKSRSSSTPAPKLIITEVTAPINKEMKTLKRSDEIMELSSQILETAKQNKITIKEIETISSDSSKCSTPGNADVAQPLLHSILAEKLSVALQKNNLPLSYQNVSAKFASDNSKQTAISKTKSTMNAVSLNSVKNLQIQSEKAAEPLADPLIITSKRKIIKRRYSDCEGFEFVKKKSCSKRAESKSLRRSPDCLGFEHDNHSAQRSRMMQNIISNLSVDILVSSSPIETPEPMEQLMPEVRIDSVPIENEPCNLQEVISNLSSQELISMHEDESSSNYSNTTSDHESVPIEASIVQELFNTASIKKINPHIIPLNQSIKPRSFHRSLMQASEVKSKSFLDTTHSSNLFEFSDSDSSISAPKGVHHKKSLTHEIDIYEKNGPVYNSYYINGVLIIVQELLITFWKQTALGNILGAQNMWLPHGNVQRISLERGCINKRSSEMILSSENSVAYVELWTKEHESKYRECPIADIFATIYFHRGHGMPDKKVLQLENIKG